MGKYNFDEIINREDTNSVKYDMREAFFGKHDVLPLWVADMDFRTPDFITEAVAQRAQHEVYGYTFRPESYYQSIINWLDKRHNWLVEKEWLHFSPGVVPALALSVLCYTQPGDSVIVQPPVYFPFFSAVKGNDRGMIENPLKIENGRYTFDFDDLKSKIQNDTRLLLLCNPHNPGGMDWTEEELTELGRICIDNNIVIVSDEIHSDLAFKDCKHIPFASLSGEFAQNSITCMAPSKTFNVAGLSTSYVVIPNKEMYAKYDAFMKASHLYGGNLFGGVALEAAYNYGADWVDEMMQYVEENYQLVKDFLEINMPGVVPMKPEATYLVWLDFSSFNITDAEINERLINSGVGLNRGVQFGKQGKGYMRMNIGCPKSIVSEALERIKNAFTNLS